MFLSSKEKAETIWACRFCPMCYVADRVAKTVQRESYSPRGRGAIIYAVEKGLLKMDPDVADIMFTTLNDGLIQKWCVGNYDHDELVLDARAGLFRQGLAPEDIVTLVNALRANPSPGAAPDEILSQANVTVDSPADILLYCGCAVRDSQAATLIAMGRLFNQARVKFQVLSKEPCCGWSLYQAGDLDGAREFSVNVAKAIKASGAGTVAVLDADCYRMLMGRTGRFGGDLQGIGITHVNKLLADWMAKGLIKITRKISEPATYHDPCVLARCFEDVDSPRNVLSAILVEGLREMATSKAMANCCGAGGLLEVHRPDIARTIARERLAEARETGARMVVTGCPRCDGILAKTANTEHSGDMRVVNLVDLVAEAAGLA
jgi:Fe-S oxidoreductase